MVSRLDRLFILLDTGSNESIRLAAAKQLGEVQRIQPNELDYLLNRIKDYSSKPVWETRIAAGHAIRCVLEHVPPWPCAMVKHEHIQDDKNKLNVRHLMEQSLTNEQVLKDFNLNEIVERCPSLLSNILPSDDLDSSSSSRGRGRKSSLTVGGRKPNKEQLQRQRQLINKELGISMVDSLNIGVKSTDIISNDDLQPAYIRETCDKNTAEKDVGQVVIGFTSHHAKLLNMLNHSEPANDKTGCASSRSTWPLESMVKDYEQGLFNPSWEVRHGSAIALREIVKSRGKYAGRQVGLPDDINDQLNQLWLIDTALKSLCVLSLDRFGDFLFDQVVAPVRENVAQLLGCCVAFLSRNNVDLIIEIVLKMLDSPCWEIRHGGVLGLKYSLNVLEVDHIKQVILRIFDAIFKCLGDKSDDVSAEAAASLVPVKDLLLNTIPEKTPKLIKFLWEHLVDLDDLRSSTSNIILLLASLITTNSAQVEVEKLREYVPRLWPLMSHSSTSVRISVLKALLTLTELQVDSCSTWMPDHTLSLSLRLVFQRSMLENTAEVRSHLEIIWLQLTKISGDKSSMSNSRLKLLKATSQYLNYWLCLTMQPSSTPIDRGCPLWLNILPDGTVGDIKPDGEVYLGSSTFNADTIEQQKIDITNCRILGTKLLGALYCNLIGDYEDSQHLTETLKYLSDMFIYYLSTKSANQRMIIAWVLESWAYYQSNSEDCERVSLPEPLSAQLQSALRETNLCYDELAADFTRVQQEARDFVSSLNAANVKTSLPNSTERRAIYNLKQIQYMCDLNIEDELNRIDSKKQSSSDNSSHDLTSTPVFSSLVSKKTALTRSFQAAKASQRNLSISTLSSIACALVSWAIRLDNLRLLIDPLLDAIESDREKSMQEKSAKYLVKLLDSLCHDFDSNEGTISMIIDRLINSLSSSLIAQQLGSEDNASPNSKDQKVFDEDRIIFLDSLQKSEQSRRQSSVNTTSSLKRSLSQSSAIDLDSGMDSPNRQRGNEIKHRGVCLIFELIVDHYGHELPVKLSQLWRAISSDIKSHIESCRSSLKSDHPEKEKDVKLIKSLIVLQIVGKNLNQALQCHLFELFTDLVCVLNSPNPSVRHQVCNCIGMISKLDFDRVEGSIISSIIPMLESSDAISRCGAIESIAFIIEMLGMKLLPKIDVFIVSVLKRMCDQNDQVRMMANHCFGKLLTLMPLNRHSAHEDGQESQLKCAESEFIEQLLNPRKLKDYKLPFKTSAQLRSYQQEGLNWLAFLNRFNLHGILCDEMGLGKTFMTICMVAADHCSSQSPSLIVCPPTLVEHWLYEFEKFVPSTTISALNPVAYGGNASDRMLIKSRLGSLEKENANLIITSYDVLRNDIDFFRSVEWNYCVLDEGHIIKNGRTKLSKAIRLITAKHRLILSGTPIQNNVTELWSLFDFLMPGFLGSERQFNSRYTKPILLSREQKCNSRDLEAGALAMESLHRQVLPFILRRLKDDVLDDLPPKILQDYYCELSPLQSKLYEDFTQSRLCTEVTKKSIGQLQSNTADVTGKSHIFQALQYLRGVCNHPKLVLTSKHSQYNQIKKYLEAEKSSLDDINHSSKLRALKQLLIDCGIGFSEESQTNQLTQQQATDIELEPVVHQHRALIFCQLRSMVEIIENDLFKKHLPSITFLKLDGSIPTNQRQSIVSRFNNDPSIDVLLLTTQIGGLGLNLTGADTVIFVEHDWNPTRDLQAMDRAHRIGQKKVVNIYRLITKNTLEEKIMGLQKFKTMVSSTIINQDNSGLSSMNVDQLLDLFGDNPNDRADRREDERRSAMDLLPELWDERQYGTEYNLDTFVSSLKS